MTTYNGTPFLEGQTAPTGTGTDPLLSMIGLREMVVVAVLYADERGNRSRSYPEYVVRDLQTGESYPGARRVQMNSGLVDGDDDVLQPATELLPGSRQQTLNLNTPARDTNGDRVLVAFLEGSNNRPIILGVLRHGDSKYGAKKADGKRRYTTHQGTSVEIKADGSYTLKRGDTSITVAADQEVSIKHKSGSAFRLLSSGDGEFIPANGKSIAVGAPEAALDSITDGVVHGDGIDTFTGTPYYALGNTSRVVKVKK